MTATPGSPSAQVYRFLEAASHLIVHYGVDKTTMEDIARRAGMSKGSLYLRWNSKTALLDALLAYEMKRMLVDFRQRLETDAEGGRIARMYTHALLALVNNPFVAALYTRDSRILGDFVNRQDLQRYTDRLMLGRTTVTQMQSAGLLRKDLSAEAITYVLSSIAVGFIHLQDLMASTEPLPVLEVGNAIASMVQSGLASSGGDSDVGKQAMTALIDLMIRQYDDDLDRSVGRSSPDKGDR